jgi:transposase-like protein
MTVLQLTDGEGSKKEAARKKAPLIDKKTRRDAIKQRAVQIPQHQGEGGRRNFTDAQKLRILNEYDKAPRKRDIIEKYRLSPSCITNWKQKREDGELRPSAGEAEEPSLDLSEEIEDGDVMIQREFADDDVSYDGPLDLVAELAALEESPPDPFEGMRGRAPM